MSPTPRRRRAAPPDPFPEHGLAELGLATGDAVRFRRRDTERWKAATVARRERDGSVGLHDARGASRSIPVECIEVRETGPRGGVVWERLADRAARTEQLPLVRDRTAPTVERRPPAGRRGGVRSGGASSGASEGSGRSPGPTTTAEPADDARSAQASKASVDASEPAASSSSRRGPRRGRAESEGRPPSRRRATAADDAPTDDTAAGEPDQLRLL